MKRRRKKSLSGRKPVPRTLPSLAETCSSFTGFQEGEARTERIFTMLQTVIQGCRRPEPQVFYSMRDVAVFFGAALGTVSKVYQRLDRLGLLTRHRSSQTMIPPRAPRTRVPVRGIVCYPIWLPGFLQFLDWRTFFSQLEEELSRHRFVLEAIFYQFGESNESAFVERVLKFNPDYLLWNNPISSDRSTMLSIGDTGVPLVVINDAATSFPGRVYRLSYSRALRKGLQAWEASGEIDQIVLPQWGVGGVSATKIIRPALKECRLPHRFDLHDQKVIGLKGSLLDYLKRLAPSPRTGIIFDDDLFYCYLCLRQPDAMYELFRRHRVMVMRGAVTPSDPIPARVTVDAILPNRRLAQQIAVDLSKGQGSLPYEGLAFEAEWRARIPLAEMVQTHVTQ